MLFNQHRNFWDRTVEEMYRGWYSKSKWFNELKKIILKYEGKVLDAGCGQGILYDYIPEIRSNYTGLDSSSNMLTFFKKRYPNVYLIEGDIRSMKYLDNSFEMVICLNTLMYFDEDLKIALKELFRITEKILIISVPITKGKTVIINNDYVQFNKKEFEEKIEELKPKEYSSKSVDKYKLYEIIKCQ